VCGRYTLATPDPGALRDRFPIGDSIQVRRRFNVVPSDEVLTVTTDREGQPRGELLRWGLVPPWADSPDTGLKMINARLETAREKPAFRGAFDRFRCLILADGFYEWQRTGAGGKQPFHITRRDGALFAFAGLWSIWYRPNGEKLRTCTILTRGANSALRELHDRMPVILAPDAEREWLDTGTAEPRLDEILGGLSSASTALRPVGLAVNDARYDGPECLALATEDRQQSLF
jgi:putative SOS response-associated peptidase YedK